MAPHQSATDAAPAGCGAKNGWQKRVVGRDLILSVGYNGSKTVVQRPRDFICGRFAVKRSFWHALALSGLLALAAEAQTASSSSDAPALSDSSPRENVAGGSVAGRSPGLRVQQALSRHNELQAQRLRGAESDDSAAQSSGSSSAAGSTGSGLSGLLGQLGGSLGSGVGGTVQSLLNLVGNSSGVSGVSAGGTSGGSSSSGSNYTIEDLIRLRDTGSLKPNQRAQLVDDEAGATANSSGGALGRLSKTAQQAQTINGGGETELKFKHRLIVSWLSTFFTALTFGFSTQDFIDQVESDLRLLFYPTPASNGDAGSSGGSSSGEGIEDVSAFPAPTHLRLAAMFGGGAARG